jgi:hypothetical protein
MQHPEEENRQCERRPNPESARHVLQLVIFLLARWNPFWLERHPADWTRARMVLLDLRVHRAGINNALATRGRRVSLKCHSALRAVSRFVGFDARTHRTIILGRRRRLHFTMRMTVVGMPVMLVGVVRVRMMAVVV